MRSVVTFALITIVSLMGCQAQAPEFGSKDVQRLQDMADAACLCARRAGEQERPAAMYTACGKQFRSEIEKVGYQLAASAPSGPMTSYAIYVGPTAKAFDEFSAASKNSPPMVAIGRTFDACTQDEEEAGYRKLRACQKRKGYGPEEDGRCWGEFYP